MVKRVYFLFFFTVDNKIEECAMRVIFLMIISICFSLASDIFIDSKTGLMWQDNREAEYLQKDWQGAVTFCEHLQLAGYDDWRLPKIKN